jgi:hypothetical protein
VGMKFTVICSPVRSHTAFDLRSGGRGVLIDVDASIGSGGATPLLVSTVELSLELAWVVFRVTEAAFLATRAFLALVDSSIFLSKVEFVQPLL